MDRAITLAIELQATHRGVQRLALAEEFAFDLFGGLVQGVEPHELAPHGAPPRRQPQELISHECHQSRAERIKTNELAVFKQTSLVGLPADDQRLQAPS